MVSPGKLQLIEELAEGTLDAFEPTIDANSGELRYPGAERYLHDRDGPAADVLAELAQWGLLTETFQEKVYLCPNCDSDQLEFTTACPACKSLHVVETEVIHHTECDHVAPKTRFASDGDVDMYVCPGCEESINVPDEPRSVLEGIEIAHQHVCQDCNGRFETPEARLQCQQCPPVVPTEASELVLYRYTLNETGRTWLDEQLAARRRVIEALTDREFETRINTAVSTEAGEEIRVHVYAEDDLLNRRIVVTVHEQPDGDDVQLLHEAATAADAHAIALTTTGTITDRAVEVARTADVELLSRRPDGTLEREYEVTEGEDDTQPFLERLTSAVTRKP